MAALFGGPAAFRKLHKCPNFILKKVNSCYSRTFANRDNFYKFLFLNVLYAISSNQIGNVYIAVVVL